ncbi:hypothetical protein UY3_09760 [Chelonia mydas]|uniref:Uncharacterized protein n=1 Tax=Chelonia mydas TaxID=8469 RepID=M7BC04_CHEMY|nr:hypothetical protein UY3_09760 [Chelonia mydas]
MPEALDILNSDKSLDIKRTGIEEDRHTGKPTTHTSQFAFTPVGGSPFAKGDLCLVDTYGFLRRAGCTHAAAKGASRRTLRC